MDVQNPYGYKTILFSDFVECVQYLGPVYALGCDGDSGHDCEQGSDNMLDRCEALTSSPQRSAMQP